MTAVLPARVIDLGTREYGEVRALQLELVTARQRDEIADTLLFVEHPEVITLGRGTHVENVVAPGGIPTFEVERGGDVTYHGPGQLVGYPILLLRPGERDLHVYLRNLEETLIRALDALGVGAGRRDGWTGVWTETKKLASIGIAVKRWVTMHGFALNVSTDLARFGAINPCGLAPSEMSSVSEALGRPVPMAEMKTHVRARFAEVFGRTLS
jgi:lipoate-protein ligase B